MVQCVAQALTTLSVCFTVSDVQLDGSGIGDAISDFWENNPAVQAREPQPPQCSEGLAFATHTRARARAREVASVGGEDGGPVC